MLLLLLLLAIAVGIYLIYKKQVALEERLKEGKEKYTEECAKDIDPPNKKR